MHLYRHKSSFEAMLGAVSDLQRSFLCVRYKRGAARFGSPLLGNRKHSSYAGTDMDRARCFDSARRSVGRTESARIGALYPAAPKFSPAVAPALALHPPYDLGWRHARECMEP